jgi:hypothetical protein
MAEERFQNPGHVVVDRRIVGTHDDALGRAGVRHSGTLPQELGTEGDARWETISPRT